jgi:hypothetical protein
MSMEPRIWCTGNAAFLSRQSEALEAAIRVLRSPRNSAFTKTNAAKDGALGALVGATTILGTVMTGGLWLPAMAAIGVSVPIITAAWQKNAADGIELTYHSARELIIIAERNITNVCGRPGTSYIVYPKSNDARWSEVTIAINAIQRLIVSLEAAGGGRSA